MVHGVPASVVARLVASALLFWALAYHRYRYYQFLRVVVTAVAAYTAFIAFAIQDAWAWFFVFCAVLFNPIVPIYLSKPVWSVINVAVAITFLFSTLVLRE